MLSHRPLKVENEKQKEGALLAASEKISKMDSLFSRFNENGKLIIDFHASLRTKCQIHPLSYFTHFRVSFGMEFEPKKYTHARACGRGKD